MSKNFLAFFRKKKLASLSKQYFTCPSKHFERKYFRKKYLYFFRHSAMKFWPFVGTFSAELSKRVQRKVSRKKQFFLIFFGYWEIKCMPFVDKGRRDCQNGLLVLQRIILMNFLSKKMFLGFFLTFSGKFWPLPRKTLRWVVKTAFYVSMKNIKALFFFKKIS